MSASSSVAVNSASGQGARRQQVRQDASSGASASGQVLPEPILEERAWMLLVSKGQRSKSLGNLVLEFYRRFVPQPSGFSNCETMSEAWALLVDKARCHPAMQKIVAYHYMYNDLSASGQGRGKHQRDHNKSWGKHPVEIIATCVVIAQSPPIDLGKSAEVAGFYFSSLKEQHELPAKVPQTMSEAQEVPLAKMYIELQEQELIEQHLKIGHDMQLRQLENSHQEEMHQQQQQLRRIDAAIDHFKEVLAEKEKSRFALVDAMDELKTNQEEQKAELQDLQQQQLSYSGLGGEVRETLRTHIANESEWGIRVAAYFDRKPFVGESEEKEIDRDVIEDMRNMLRELDQVWLPQPQAPAAAQSASRSRSPRRLERQRLPASLSRMQI